MFKILAISNYWCRSYIIIGCSPPREGKTKRKKPTAHFKIHNSLYILISEKPKNNCDAFGRDIGFSIFHH